MSKSVSEFFACYSEKMGYIEIHPLTRCVGSHCKLQAFTHASNVVHTGSYSLVLATILNKVLQPLLPGETSVKDSPQPDEGAEDSSTARR